MRAPVLLAAVPLLAGLIAGCQGGTASPASPVSARATTLPGGVVPWVDRPAPAYTGPPPPKFSTDARSCRPSDLRTSAGEEGAATGHIEIQLRFTNRSATACLLAGYPTSVAAVSGAGAVRPLNVARGGFFGNPGPAANIAPGQTAAVFLSSWDMCQAALDGQRLVYPVLRIGLPGGGTADAPAAGLNAICGLQISKFGIPDQPAPPAPSPLTATIKAPATIRPGQVLTYTVTLTNPTDHNYPLRPCPSYREYVFAETSKSSAGADRYYYLNCDAVHEIRAHASVSYQMRLMLPASLLAGFPAKFVWYLQGDTILGASTPLSIVS